MTCCMSAVKWGMVDCSDISTTPSRDTNGAATIFRNLDLLRQAASADPAASARRRPGGGGAAASEGLLERLASQPVQPPKLGLADLGELLQPRVPGRGQRAACRAGEIGRGVHCSLIVRLLRHGFSPSL